jgi:hypothetical protein
VQSLCMGGYHSSRHEARNVRSGSCVTSIAMSTHPTDRKARERADEEEREHHRGHANIEVVAELLPMRRSPPEWITQELYARKQAQPTQGAGPSVSSVSLTDSASQLNRKTAALSPNLSRRGGARLKVRPFDRE